MHVIPLQWSGENWPRSTSTPCHLFYGDEIDSAMQEQAQSLKSGSKWRRSAMAVIVAVTWVQSNNAIRKMHLWFIVYIDTTVARRNKQTNKHLIKML